MLIHRAQVRAKLTRDFMSFIFNSDSPETWDPDEVKKFEKIRGETGWLKLRKCLKEIWTHSEKQERDLQNARIGQKSAQKEAKRERARGSRNNCFLDNLQ